MVENLASSRRFSGSRSLAASFIHLPDPVHVVPEDFGGPGALRKMRPPVGRGLERGCPPPQVWESGGVSPGKILKFETQFGAIWCILARN